MSLPPPSDIETGVSNGDVDWLFRGKSKKLTKKLISERRPSTSSVPEKARADSLDDKKPESGKARLADSELNSATAKLLPVPSTPPISKLTPEKSEQDSALLLQGRSRSVSAPQVTDSEKAAAQKRRSSLNFISMAAGGTPVDVEPSVPQPAPQPRGSPSTKRSFFSLLSSKFKATGSVASSAPSPKDTSSSPSISPTVTTQQPKLNPNLIGSATLSNSGQDLASLVNRLPAEIGIPTSLKLSRRSSISSSPKLFEMGGFFKRKALVVEATLPKVVFGKSYNREKQPPKAPLRLRRVAFALDKLGDDPQQQIPSRRPRKGNVLIPEDLTAPLPRLAQGVSVSDSNGVRTTVTETKYSEKELQMAIDAQKRALLEAEKHAMEAHLSAKRLAGQILLYKVLTKGFPAPVEEDEVDVTAEMIEIDKPLHLHENHFQSEDTEDANKELSLETIYTRCCHLREILPIPATLKQLKNKTRPLQVLKLLNPKPTLIDVLSFSDFIAITPINTVIFDNVTMTTEMLKHLLSALVHSRHLEKLSLRNVAIDETGWVYLCEFLERNQIVKKLDVSQQRVKQLTKQTSFRLAMNWDLLIKSIISRNGIEELVMGGCKLSDETFENLLENALTIATCRLGVAAIELNIRKCEIIADWCSRPNSKCVGIDIAYNDLSQGQLRPFIDALNTKELQLVFFLLNSTNLSNVDEVGELLRGLAKVKTLKFLDLSSLPQLFPGVISKLSKFLPLFSQLKRIHFDLNELSSQSIDAIADVLPRVPSLVHVSLLGNRNLDRGSIGSLYTAVKSSVIFTLDLDYDLVPDELSHRLALYLMRNMDRIIRPDIIYNICGNEQDDLMFDGSLLMESAEKMLMESDKTSGEADLKLQRIITNALLERTNAIRKNIHKIIDQKFEKRNQGTLSFEGKESLLRFCLLDASLEKVVHLFEQKAMMFSSTPLSPSPSIPETPTVKISLAMEADHDQLHESSTALIDAGPILMAKNSRPGIPGIMLPAMDQTLQPHLVVVEASSDGKAVPIDNLTGRPVLMKSVSQTSLHAKKQEQEEGEFHRWGYFMEHRNSFSDQSEETKLEVPVLSAVPSGSELREAIIDAKGIESVTQLISKINNNRVSLDKIYSLDGLHLGEEVQEETYQDASEKHGEDDLASIDSQEDHNVHPVVDKAYDKLLNEAERVRSNKESG